MAPLLRLMIGDTAKFCYRFTLKDVNYDLIAVTYDAKAYLRLKMRLIVKIRS